MNDEIKQLRKQALDWVQHNLETVERDHAVMEHEQLEMVNEKFAELIVRECMAQIKEVKELSLPYNANREQSYEFGYDDGMTVAIRTIEEHFGVDE